MASRTPAIFRATMTRQRTVSAGLARYFTTTPARPSAKQQVEASFVRRVWADPQMRRIAIGSFIVLAGVETYTWVTYGPRLWAYLKGEEMRG